MVESWEMQTNEKWKKIKLNAYLQWNNNKGDGGDWMLSNKGDGRNDGMKLNITKQKPINVNVI